MESKHTLLIEDETYEIYEVEETADNDEATIEDVLVQNRDGSMSIQIKREEKPETTVLVEHICGKCNKTYKKIEVNCARSSLNHRNDKNCRRH